MSPTKYPFLHGPSLPHGTQWLSLLTTLSHFSRPLLQNWEHLVHTTLVLTLPLNILLLCSSWAGFLGFPYRHHAYSLLMLVKMPTPFSPCYFSRPSRSLTSSRKLSTAVQPMLTLVSTTQNYSTILIQG